MASCTLELLQPIPVLGVGFPRLLITYQLEGE